MNDNKAAKDAPFQWITEIPEPTEDDLKWAKKFDARFHKNLTKDKDGTDKKLLKMVESAIDGDKIWCFAHALELRHNNTKSRLFFRVDHNMCSFFNSDHYSMNNVVYRSSNSKIHSLYFEAGLYVNYLFQSLCSQNMDIIKKWLKYGTQDRKDLALCATAQAGYLKDFIEIYNLGADINAVYATSLFHAIQYQDLEFVKFIVEQGGDYTAENFKALALAKEFDKPDIQAYLLEKHRGNDQKAAVTGTQHTAQNGWIKTRDTMIGYHTPLIDKTGTLTDYFDFAARSMSRVEENEKGVFPHFEKNFLKIENQDLIQHARQELIDQGGDPDAQIFKKRVSKLPDLKIR